MIIATAATSNRSTLQRRQKLGRLLQDPMNQPAAIIAELALSSAAAFAIQFYIAKWVATSLRHG
jgi:hypothetical protein